MPTKEELDEVFAQATEDMKELIRKSILDGTCQGMGPSVMMVMRKVPDLKGTPLSFIPLGEPLQEDGKPKVGIFTPVTLTPAGLPVMPKHVFWNVMKILGLATNAYGMIVGMEAWWAQAEPGQELPESLEDHPGRKEVGLVTTELEGKRAMYFAEITRAEDGTVTLGPWTDASEGKEDVELSGNPFRAIPANVHN